MIVSLANITSSADQQYMEIMLEVEYRRLCQRLKLNRDTKWCLPLTEYPQMPSESTK